MEGRCVHQIGLFRGIVSHGLCDAQGDIGDTLLMAYLQDLCRCAEYSVEFSLNFYR